MDINTARTLANIQERADRITEDYHCTIHPESIAVTRNGDPARFYIVKDGACPCGAYDKYRTCKHLLGLPALIEAEIDRLTELCTVSDSPTYRNAIQNGKDILDAHLCEVDIATYRTFHDTANV